MRVCVVTAKPKGEGGGHGESGVTMGPPCAKMYAAAELGWGESDE